MLASTVAPGIECHYSVLVSRPSRCGFPFASVTGDSLSTLADGPKVGTPATAAAPESTPETPTPSTRRHQARLKWCREELGLAILHFRLGLPLQDRGVGCSKSFESRWSACVDRHLEKHLLYLRNSGSVTEGTASVRTKLL